jgi:hypothetical protein
MRGGAAAQPERTGPDEPVRSRLEQRYRRWLRLLPASYRAVWADEMVATFAESMATDDPEEAEFAADYGRPSWAEVGSVVALAVRLRLGTAGGPARYAAWGAAIRQVALLGLLAQAVLSIDGALLRLWSAGKLPGLAPPAPGWTLALPTSRLSLAWEFSGLLWAAAYLALVFGHRLAARLLTPLAIVPTAATTTPSTLTCESLRAWSCLS